MYQTKTTKTPKTKQNPLPKHSNSQLKSSENDTLGKCLEFYCVKNLLQISACFTVKENSAQHSQFLFIGRNARLPLVCLKNERVDKQLSNPKILNNIQKLAAPSWIFQNTW